MNARLCPNCSALIESESAFFCYNCGQEITSPPPAKAVTPPVIGAKEPVRRRMGKSRLASVLLIVLLVLTVSLTMLLIRKRPIQSQRPALSPTQSERPLPSNEFVSTSSALPVAPFDFSTPDFASLVPSEATLYIQSRSPSLLLKRLLSQEQQDEFGKVSGLTFTEALSFLDDDYAYARGSEGFLFLSQVKDTDFVKSKLSEFGKEELLGELIGDILIVSDSDRLLKAVKSVSAKSRLSLSQVNHFFDGRRRLPKEGQALIYSEGKEGGLPEISKILFGKDIFGDTPVDLRGSVFVVESVFGSAKIVGVYGQR